MLFNSLEFLFFFFIVTVVYYIIPHKTRWIWVLLSSYYFYMKSNPKYIIILIFITALSYLSGIAIEKSIKYKKNVMILGILCNIAVLFVFKYYNFFIKSMAGILTVIHIKLYVSYLTFSLPIGISFYIFEAMAYIIDVYRGNIKAEKNLLKYASFIAFFPQLLAGPIERAGHMLVQFEERHSFNYEKIKSGLLLMLWGLFQKLVVADRLSKFTDTVFMHPNSYRGFEMVIASLFFTFQIYCDFSGYSDMAIGAARVLGFDLSRNFKRPYFSKSIKEFWRRWHITLCLWFKDYLYIPLGGNRCSKLKNYRNIMIVFIVSGLWHGADVSFIVWGTLHGVYQLIEKWVEPLNNRIINTLKIKVDSSCYKAFQIFRTFVLVDFAWIFFKADSFKNAVIFIKNMFYFNPQIFTDGSIYKLGLSQSEFTIAVVGIAVVLIGDLLQRNNSVYSMLMNRNTLIRWSAYLISIVFIIIFGMYGGQYNPQKFIYFQF